MSENLEKTYNPKAIEAKLYEKWCDNKYFHAEVDRSKKPFTTVMPPPNITGKLHMGHALDNTLQDILIRYKRMQGYNALWIPGTDHAAISTEVKVTNQLKEEGIDKKELGREKFLERTWQWKEEYGGTITSQLKKMGVSCDWDRERFTMDEGCSKAVEEVFINLYNKGYIYKGSRIINWCPVCQTSISDAEVVYEEQAGHFWHIKYPIVGTDRFLEIATTRPETLLGDTAIAVHPDDERYQDIIGKNVILCNGLRINVAMVIDDRHMLCILVVEHLAGLIGEEQLFAETIIHNKYPPKMPTRLFRRWVGSFHQNPIRAPPSTGMQVPLI